MSRAILCCIAVALGCLAQAQTPTVVGVGDDPPSSQALTPGAIGYVYGSGFDAVGDTAVTVGGLNAEVLEVSNNRIRAHFPSNLPAGMAELTVTVAGRVSETVKVLVASADSGKGSIGGGPMAPDSPRGLALPYSKALKREAPVSPQAISPQSSRDVSLAVNPTGIVYTCDPTVTAASSTACTTLNSTIAGLYSAAFSNANAAIYVTLGSTDLGMSGYLYNTSSYSNFRNLLITAESDANDTIAVTDSVPAANPFGSSVVDLPTALQRASGFNSAPSTGYKSDGVHMCTLGTTGCYDGVITVSNAVSLYFRTGSISGNQYDFFTVVEHETDEILGTASCAIYLCGGDVAPTDFFRYHSNGSRSGLSAGTDDSCSSSDSTNACFSLDGHHMLQQYNNLNNGEDAGDWLPPSSCSSTLVQDATLCSGVAGVDISPQAEILLLDVVGYKRTASSATGLQFYPVTPCRLVDTRGSGGGFNGIAPFSGPSLASGQTVTFPVQSAVEAGANTGPAPCGTIPSTAQAYSLNVTVVPHAGGAVNYVSLWPSGSAQPVVSTLNDGQGEVLANAAIVPAGTPSGGISVYNAGPSTADVILDLNGYFAATTTQGSVTGLQFYPVSPCRLVDTRGASVGFNGISPFSGPSLLSGATANFPVQSSSEATADTTPAPCGTISSGAKAYSLNSTLVPQAGVSDNFITLWPSGLAQPVVSTLNDGQGEVVANAAIVPAGTPSGGVNVFNEGPVTADVILDMNGYFAAPKGLKFYPVSPCRLVDTRGPAAGFNGISPFSGPSIAAGGTITIPVQSAAEASANTTPAPCGTIPSSAQAYSLNLTLVPQIVLTDAYPGAVNYVTIWPAGLAQPVVSTINDPEALVVANAAIVPAGSGSGGISVYNAGPSATDVVLDMNGYFGP